MSKKSHKSDARFSRKNGTGNLKNAEENPPARRVHLLETKNMRSSSSITVSRINSFVSVNSSVRNSMRKEARKENVPTPGNLWISNDLQVPSTEPQRSIERKERVGPSKLKDSPLKIAIPKQERALSASRKFNKPSVNQKAKGENDEKKKKIQTENAIDNEKQVFEAMGYMKKKLASVVLDPVVIDRSLPPLWIRDEQGNMQLLSVPVATPAEKPNAEPRKIRTTKPKIPPAKYRVTAGKSDAREDVFEHEIAVKPINASSAPEPKPLTEDEVAARLAKQEAYALEQKNQREIIQRRILEREQALLANKEKKIKKSKRRVGIVYKLAPQLNVIRANQYMKHVPHPNMFCKLYDLPPAGMILFGPFENSMKEIEKNHMEERKYRCQETLMFDEENSKSILNK